MSHNLQSKFYVGLRRTLPVGPALAGKAVFLTTRMENVPASSRLKPVPHENAVSQESTHERISHRNRRQRPARQSIPTLRLFTGQPVHELLDDLYPAFTLGQDDVIAVA